MPKGFGGGLDGGDRGSFILHGIEVIAVTSGETKDPVHTIPAALRSMALRLFLFYVLALGIVVTLSRDRNRATVVTSESLRSRLLLTPAFGTRRHHEFCGATAALENEHERLSMLEDALFPLSRGITRRAFLARLSKNGTPIAAILTSGVCILLAGRRLQADAARLNYLFGVALLARLLYGSSCC